MKKSNKKSGLYPYTLQPVALNLSTQEFQKAQLALFEQSAKNYTITAIKPKEWWILGAIVALAVLGLIFVNGYSTILFWLMLVGVAIYLLLRTLGLKWYMQKEYEKQVASQTLPDEMAQMKLGVQSHGLIMSLPINGEQLTHQMRGMTMRGNPTQQAVIPWSAVSSWDETDDFIFIMFELQGQRGSQIIPKRLKNNNLPIDTVIKHLSEVKAKGLQMENMSR